MTFDRSEHLLHFFRFPGETKAMMSHHVNHCQSMDINLTGCGQKPDMD